MDSSLILDSPWPDDLDPTAVPFKVRTKTVLRRAGYYDEPQLFNTLTEAEVLGWWNAGPATVADLRFTGNRAIRRRHEEGDERSEMNIALADVAAEQWAQHIWHRDPRFSRYVPKATATVKQIASAGRPEQRRSLWHHLEGLRAAVAAQSALTLPEAVAQYVASISGQRGRRLTVLLARTGLNGRDPISGPRAAQMLRVSSARIYQIQDQLERRRVWAQPPDGVWMPQLTNTTTAGWPDEYTERGIAATRTFFAVTQPQGRG